jgi:hypothetical protein
VVLEGREVLDDLIRSKLTSVRLALRACIVLLAAQGFRENIVGSATDDAVDALDRRVEFKIVPCG